jgi:signal peptidase
MRKAVKIIKKAVFGLIAIFALCMALFTLVSFSTFNRTDRSLFGYKVFVVLSDSMSATDFRAGDIVLARKVDPSALKEGDIITFVSQNEGSFGQTVTHKIRRKTTDEQGNPGFITYGTSNNTDDKAVVTYPYVVGKYQRRIPKIGGFFQFLKTVPGYIVCILTPFSSLIVLQCINSVKLFNQYKSEQMRLIREEREKIEAERAESQKVLDELLRMKAQLALDEAGKSISGQ